MNPGKLRHKIEFGKFKEITDNEGFKEKEWVPKFPKRASATNLYGREFWEAKAVQGDQTVKFECRYDSRIDTSLYIKFQGNYYEIIAPPDDIKYLHRELEIKAKLLDKDKINGLKL